MILIPGCLMHNVDIKTVITYWTNILEIITAFIVLSQQIKCFNHLRNLDKTLMKINQWNTIKTMF